MNISIKTGRISFSGEESKDMQASLKRARDILDAFEKGLSPKPKMTKFISFDIFTYSGFKTAVLAKDAVEAKVWAAKAYGGHPEMYRVIATK